MIYKSLFISLLFVFGTVSSQNLVPNPGFEERYDTPQSISQWYKCKYWNNVKGDTIGRHNTPDYYTTSSPGGTYCVHLPINDMTTVPLLPNSTAVMGAIAYGPYFFNYCEYLGVKLDSAMLPGHSYRVYYYMFFATAYDRDGGRAVAHMGCNLTKEAMHMDSCEYLNITPTFQIDTPYGRLGWNKVGFTIVPSDSLNYLTLGCFGYYYLINGQAVSNLQDTIVSLTGAKAYYFYDNVMVKEIHHSRDTSICLGNTVRLYDSRDTIHKWYLASQPQFLLSDSSVFWVSPSVTTDYTLITEDDTVPIRVSVVSPPPAVGSSDTSICQGERVDCGRDNWPGWTYLWSNGNTNANQLFSISGDYMLTTDSAGCLFNDTFHILVNPLPPIELQTDTVLCEDNFWPIDITQTGCSYLWNDGNTSPIRLISTPGLYTAILTDLSTGCINTDSLLVTFEKIPNLFLGDDTIICEGDELILNAYYKGASYIWQDGSNGYFIQVSNPGLYWVQSQDICGSIVDSISVDEVHCECKVVVPNVFSPNDDGRNDIFKAIVTCPSLSGYDFRIYNRWGQMVFETTNPLVGWDGKVNDVDQSSDTYFWYLSYSEELNGNEKVSRRQGGLTLMR